MTKRKQEAPLIRRLEGGQTVSLGTGDDINASIALGHIGAREMNRRFKKEGWVADPVPKAELSHEYWVIGKNSAKRSTKDNARALAVTVVGW